MDFRPAWGHRSSLYRSQRRKQEEDGAQDLCRHPSQQTGECHQRHEYTHSYAQGNEALICLHCLLEELIHSKPKFFSEFGYCLLALLLLALREEPITLLRVGSLGLGLLGVYLLIGPGGQVDLLGAGLVLASAVLYPLHVALVTWHVGGYRSQAVALCVVTSMAAILILVRLVSFRPWQPMPAAGVRHRWGRWRGC